MAVDREPIAVALFDRLKVATGVVTAGRRLRFWDEMDATEQPAMFLLQGEHSPRTRRGLPPVWALSFTCYLYCRNPEPAEAPATMLNRMIRAVEAALELQPGETAEVGDFRDLQNVAGTTLGGLCSHAWIAGTITTDEGALGDQAVAVLPIEVLTT